MLAPPERYRTFWPRLWAGLIDGLVFAPLSWLDTWVWQTVSEPSVLAGWFILNSLVFVGYSIALHGLFGQTIGKRLMGIQVLDISESKLSMKQALLRDSVFLGFLVIGLAIDLPAVASGANPYDPESFTLSNLSIAALISLYAFLAWFLLELVSMLLNPKRRAIHDLIAGSVVVRRGSAPPNSAI